MALSHFKGWSVITSIDMVSRKSMGLPICDGPVDNRHNWNDELIEASNRSTSIRLDEHLAIYESKLVVDQENLNATSFFDFQEGANLLDKWTKMVGFNNLRKVRN